MIRVTNLSKSYGAKTLFRDGEFTIHSKERVGIIGRNGYGKSTLFRIFLDEEQADTGEISFPSHYTLGSLRQHLSFTKKTVLEEVADGLMETQKSEIWRAEKFLHGLGFSTSDFIRNPEEFSGGYQLRIELAKTILGEPKMLLLDEPTNYLDILSLRWLERFLQSYNGEVLVISHDEAFLDAVTTQKVVIYRQRLRKMKGTVREVWTQILKEEEVHEKSRLHQEKEKSRQEEFIRTFRAGARSAGLVQSRIKMLEKLEPLYKIEKIPPIRFSFSFFSSQKPVLGEGENLSYGYTEEKPLFTNFSFSVCQNECIGIIGKNGQGKSTFLRMIHEEMVPQCGKLSFGKNTKMGYFGQTNRESLHPEKTILEELRHASPTKTEEEIRTLAGSLLFSGEDVHKKIKVLSGGEKSRVSLGKIFLTPVNLLLLDEPTNHLDMESSTALLEALKKFQGGILLVSHNEKLLQELCTKCIVFENGNAKFYHKTYDEFLTEVGWSEEKKDEGEGEKIQKGKVSYLERKEQQKELRKIQKDLEECLEKIEKLEKETGENAEFLQKACEEKNYKNIEEYGKKAKELEDLLKKEYARWEELLVKESECEGLAL